MCVNVTILLLVPDGPLSDIVEIERLVDCSTLCDSILTFIFILLLHIIAERVASTCRYSFPCSSLVIFLFCMLCHFYSFSSARKFTVPDIKNHTKHLQYYILEVNNNKHNHKPSTNHQHSDNMDNAGRKPMRKTQQLSMAMNDDVAVNEGGGILHDPSLENVACRRMTTKMASH